MNADQIAVARSCVAGARAGNLSFPQILAKLIEAGLESYTVDYRRNTQTFYSPDGDSVVIDKTPLEGNVSAEFDAAVMAGLVRWAQANRPDYSYAAFSEKAKAAGCAGYFVSLLGRRVLYFGRTGETHVEYMPS